jgi:hypothetical protein
VDAVIVARLQVFGHGGADEVGGLRGVFQSHGKGLLISVVGMWKAGA